MDGRERGEHEHDGEEDPAGDEGALGEALRIRPEENDKQHGNKQREEQGESAAFDERLHG